MQDSEQHEKCSEQNDRLMSEFAITRRQSRSLYRNWVVLSKKTGGSLFQSQSNVFSKISSCSIVNDGTDFTLDSSSSLIEDRADEIVRHMEQNQPCMDDNPKFNNDRIETLREMTEYLTLKRSVKRKLMKSKGPSNKTLSLSKRLKYRISIFFFKIPVTFQHFLSTFELWYSSLKVIEGHFGSSVASYFKFLRKLFFLNTFVFIIMLFFIMVPQLLFRFIHYVESNENSSVNGNITFENGTRVEFNFEENPKSTAVLVMRSNPYRDNGEFRFGNLFTGEGFLTNTILFYGYYSNTSLQLLKAHSYSIPASYFFTSSLCYALVFLFLFVSVAVSYRKCYIEASGGMNNTFTNKVFCGWDFGIATKQAAELKSRSIYIEIKELLDELQKPIKRKTCANTFYTTAICFSLNGILLFLLGVGGMYSWKYLDQQMTKADTATTMMMWLILTLVIALSPVLFSLIAHLEGFESPSSALYMTLIRTFTLYAVVIAVVMAYRLNRTEEAECWETIIGQDMYRLVVLDFIFGLIGTTLSEFIRYRIYVKMWRGIGCPEFDIARSTMNLIYNQTLFYIGLYFSPALSLVITIKLFITFYIKKWGAIYNCKPFVKPWKASQATTVYLSIAFFAFFSVVIAYGYIITSVKTSNCGPFRGEKYTYRSLLEEIISKNDSTVLMGIYYITRPGVVGIVLMAMLLGVYYMRAVAMARIHVVHHLRHLLRLKAEDRKLLLHEISKYSKNQILTGDKNSPLKAKGESPIVNHVIHKFPKSKENFLLNERQDVSAEDQLKKGKFSSLSNLQLESNTNSWKHGSKFISIQNISDFENDVKEVKYKFKESSQCLNKNYEETCFDDAQSSNLWEENAENNSRGKSSPYILSEDLGLTELGNSSGGLDESEFKVTRLNFNPVFTESCPFQSNVEEEYVHVVNVETVNRLSVSEERQNILVDQNHSLTSQLSQSQTYNRFQERVPSRISFESDSEKKIGKKKKNR